MVNPNSYREWEEKEKKETLTPDADMHPLSPFPDAPRAHFSGQRSGQWKQLAMRGRSVWLLGSPFRHLGTCPCSGSWTLGQPLGALFQPGSRPLLPSRVPALTSALPWKPPFAAPLSGRFPAQGRCLSPAHRAIAVILFCKFPVVVVVECGVGLDGLLLTQVLVFVSDAVNSSTGNLQAQRKGGSAQEASHVRPGA